MYVFSVVTGFATPHTIARICCRQSQRRLTLGKLVQGTDQVICITQATWIKIKMCRATFFPLSEEDGVVQGVVAIHTTYHTVGVDVERVVQFLFTGNIQTAVQQFLW
jgi:hypothetical protein